MERGLSIRRGKSEGRPQTETKTLVAADRVSHTHNCAVGDGRYKVVHPGNYRAASEASIARFAAAACSVFVFAIRACL